jgi:hydroxypyruvate reductase
VTHAVGANEEDVADFAIGQILNIRRRIIVGDQLVRNGEWKMGHRPLTHSVAGLRLGIVGLGQIGQALARRADVMRMIVSWWGPHDKPGAPWPRIGCLLELAHVSDVLAVTASANGDNSGLISAEVLAALGSTGILINVARGSLVDEDALICALRRGALSAAALDVFREEPTSSDRWHGVPNIILSPHLAGATEEALCRMAELVHLNLNAFFSGKPLPTPVAEAA